MEPHRVKEECVAGDGAHGCVMMLKIPWGLPRFAVALLGMSDERAGSLRGVAWSLKRSSADDCRLGAGWRSESHFDGFEFGLGLPGSAIRTETSSSFSISNALLCIVIELERTWDRHDF